MLEDLLKELSAKIEEKRREWKKAGVIVRMRKKKKNGQYVVNFRIKGYLKNWEFPYESYKYIISAERLVSKDSSIFNYGILKIYNLGFFSRFFLSLLGFQVGKKSCVKINLRAGDDSIYSNEGIEEAYRQVIWNDLKRRAPGLLDIILQV